MRTSLLLSLCLAMSACGSNANRTCTPVPSFSAPAGECVALVVVAMPPPPAPVPVKEPEPEPEPVPEPVPIPEPEPAPPPPVVVKADKIELDRTVQFESGSAKLVEDSKTLLGDVAKVLTEHDEIKLVRVEGHTDAQGSNRANKRLSDKRAKVVRAFLIAAGIANKRLVARGFGEDEPAADNGTEEGRFKNRRVELTILKRVEPKESRAVEEKEKLDDETAEPKKPGKKKPKN